MLGDVVVEPPVPSVVLVSASCGSTLSLGWSVGVVFGCLGMPNGFLALPRTLRSLTASTEAIVTMGSAVTGSISASTAATGGGVSASFASTTGTATSAATKRIATGQRRRSTSW